MSADTKAALEAAIEAHICEGPACGRRAVRRGLCHSHAMQRSRGATLKPLRRMSAKGSGSIRDELGRKKCFECEEWLPTNSFTKGAGQADGLRNYCRNCVSQHSRQKRYGLDPQRFAEMANLGCQICGKSEPTEAGWQVDHDHSCCPGAFTCGRCVRGLLCARCNLLIGKAQDNPGILLAAAEYLMGNR